MKLLENNIDLVLSSIEWPSTIENEKQSIQDYVDQVAEYFPDGVSATEVMENLPDELPYSIQLKTLIELAKRKLLTLGATDYKPSPMEVLKIYGNPKHTAEKTQFNMNELEVNNPVNYQKIWDECWEQAADEIGESDDDEDGNWELWNEDEVNELACKLFKEKTGKSKDDLDLYEAKPCWKGYKQIGMKKKGKREVPNCVPINELEINNPVINAKDEILLYLNNIINKLEKWFKNKEYWVTHSYMWILKSLKAVVTELEIDSRFINEAKYQGRTVQLNKPSKGDIKKFKVYVKNPKTCKIVKVNFGDKNLKIKKK